MQYVGIKTSIAVSQLADVKAARSKECAALAEAKTAQIAAQALQTQQHAAELATQTAAIAELTHAKAQLQVHTNQHLRKHLLLRR